MALFQAIAVLLAGHFPFRFQREACTAPAGIGIGFKPAQVAHRGIRVELPSSGEGELLLPCLSGSCATPVARCFPALLLPHRPAFAHPQIGTLVAPIGDEAAVLGIADQLGLQFERFQPDPMTRGLVVEVKALARVTDLHQAALTGQPFPSIGSEHGRELGVRCIDRLKRLT